MFAMARSDLGVVPVTYSRRTYFSADLPSDFISMACTTSESVISDLASSIMHISGLHQSSERHHDGLCAPEQGEPIGEAADPDLPGYARCWTDPQLFS